MKQEKKDEWIDENVCGKGRCRQPSAIVYLGLPLCDEHWIKHCEKEEEAEDRSNRD